MAIPSFDQAGVPGCPDGEAIGRPRASYAAKSGGDRAGLGIACSVQVRPFHRSANVRSLETFPAVPTAMHASAEAHATRRSSEAAFTFGVGWIDHPAPWPPAKGMAAAATASAALPARRIIKPVPFPWLNQL
jgi:hypothetical protein